MRQVLWGAVLLSAGIAAFIEAHTYKPHRPEIEPLSTAPLSRGSYDLVRITGWVLVVFGAVILITGLIRCWTELTGEREQRLEALRRTEAREEREERRLEER